MESPFLFLFFLGGEAVGIAGGKFERRDVMMHCIYLEMLCLFFVQDGE